MALIENCFSWTKDSKQSHQVIFIIKYFKKKSIMYTILIYLNNIKLLWCNIYLYAYIIYTFLLATVVQATIIYTFTNWRKRLGFFFSINHDERLYINYRV